MPPSLCGLRLGLRLPVHLKAGACSPGRTFPPSEIVRVLYSSSFRVRPPARALLIQPRRKSNCVRTILNVHRSVWVRRPSNVGLVPIAALLAESVLAGAVHRWPAGLFHFRSSALLRVLPRSLAVVSDCTMLKCLSWVSGAPGTFFGTLPPLYPFLSYPLEAL
jgi:hypothetical protein